MREAAPRPFYHTPISQTKEHVSLNKITFHEGEEEERRTKKKRRAGLPRSVLDGAIMTEEVESGTMKTSRVESRNIP
jgi:hypothetical protein